MRIDPQVSRLKFDRDVATLVHQRAVLESRGIFLLTSTKYPHVDILFVSKHPLRAAVPAQLATSTSLILPTSATRMMLIEFPSLSIRAFKARFDLTDYDLRAPSLEFRDPWTDLPLEYRTMFRALEFEKDRKAHLVLLDDHPNTHKPFLCLRGIREYHEHPQHSGDDWLLYRGTMNLFSIVMSVWRASVDLVHPQLIPQANGFQLNSVAEEKV